MKPLALAALLVLAPLAALAEPPTPRPVRLTGTLGLAWHEPDESDVDFTLTIPRGDNDAHREPLVFRLVLDEDQQLRYHRSLVARLKQSVTVTGYVARSKDEWFLIVDVIQDDRKP
jgi:hypothetical protein